ncbi:unnamed protein product [Schistosoma margrebowiei]|uniref:Uncharacterized protein n=1 Tax=Schistosoma margrebowiei TaxID=48269 RepID=A0A183N3R0_9TREM|nr:unnamed protein product [Schistosoma margrebowiei]
MEPVMELLDIYSDFDAFEDYFERFEIRATTKEDDEDVNSVRHFLTFIGKEAYSLLKTLALPENPISLSYTTLKDLLLDYVKYTDLECGKGGRFRKTIRVDIKNSTALHQPNSVHTQGYADNSLRSCSALHENWRKFGQCLSCGKFHAFSSCKFRNSNCFKCGDIGHIQSVCNTNVHLIVTNIKFHENISEETNPDVILCIAYPHNAFAPCEKLVQCEARVLNELDFDYNSDDFISTAVHPYHKSTSNVYFNQCEK